MLGYATDLSDTSFGNKTVRALCSWRRMEARMPADRRWSARLQLLLLVRPHGAHQ